MRINHDWTSDLDVENEDGAALAAQIADMLPHGSGINGTWLIEQLVEDGEVRPIFHCHNTYDAMNDVGGYCHFWNFTVPITVGNTGKLAVGDVTIEGNTDDCECGCGLDDYLLDTIYESCNGQSITI